MTAADPKQPVKSCGYSIWAPPIVHTNERKSASIIMGMNLRKAILLAPLTQIAITAIAALLFGILEGSTTKEILVSWVALSLFSTPIAYIVTIVIGVPVHFLLKKRNLSAVKNYSIAGAIIGGVGAIILSLPYTTVSFVSYWPIIFLSSLIVATTFGVLAMPRSNDGDVT